MPFQCISAAPHCLRTLHKCKKSTCNVQKKYCAWIVFHMTFVVEERSLGALSCICSCTIKCREQTGTPPFSPTTTTTITNSNSANVLNVSRCKYSAVSAEGLLFFAHQHNHIYFIYIYICMCVCTHTETHSHSPWQPYY